MIEIAYEQNEHDAYTDLLGRVQALREVCLDDVTLRPETVLKVLGFKEDVKELEKRKEERHQRLIAYLKENIAVGGAYEIE